MSSILIGEASRAARPGGELVLSAWASVSRASRLRLSVVSGWAVMVVIERKERTATVVNCIVLRMKTC